MEDPRYDTSELTALWSERSGPPLAEDSPAALAVSRARCELADIDATMVGWIDRSFLHTFIERAIVEFSEGGA